MFRRSFFIAAGIALILAAAFLVGPRIDVDGSIREFRVPGNISRFIDSVEASYADLIPGTERKIVWHDSSSDRTSVSLVYIHGFSASRAELAPLCDSLAAHLRANVYYVRLTGHGRTGSALAAASANDWLNDMVEAVEIGRAIGDHVVLIGNSTGSTLITWFLATQDTDRIAAAVLLSPNYGPRDARSRILLWHWGGYIAELVVGTTRTWQPQNAEQARFWTTSYPTRALVPMMGLVDLVDRLDLGGITKPVLILYSKRDTVVDTARIADRFEAIGSISKRIVAVETNDQSGHILAGRILSPSTTAVVGRIIESYLAEVLADPNWLFARATVRRYAHVRQPLVKPTRLPQAAQARQPRLGRLRQHPGQLQRIPAF